MIQLELFQTIPPGTYTVAKPWTNEMGYTWEPGERIEILEHRPQFATCIVRQPGQQQHFEILQVHIQNFKINA